MKNFYILFLSVTLTCFNTFGQETKRVLFLGNSYTGVNNLPVMVSALATSAGDAVQQESNTPGGYTFQGHTTNQTSLDKIGQGNWDFVVLQEQSQLPSFPDGQVQSDVFPYAAILDSIINAENECVETMFYMTWGRKTGDASNCASWPPVCTYEGMDDLLAARYMQMANDNNAVVSPVGKVWRYLRENFPTIELYQADNSHPSVAGTYAAACCFYACIFEKDPLLITDDQGLSAADALTIRNAVKTVVYDDFLAYNIGLWDLGPTASYTFDNSNGQEVSFMNTSTNGSTFEWNFGDGTYSTDENPVHLYTTTGSFDVILTVTGCNEISEISETVVVALSAVSNAEQVVAWNIFPNPLEDFLNFESDSPVKSIIISNNIGQVVEKYDLNETKTTIDLTSLPAGIYFVQFNDNPETKILIKQ